jgi:O-methyltransferase
MQGKLMYGKYPVYAPSELKDIEFDEVQIAVIDVKIQFSMYADLVNNGVSTDKIKVFDISKLYEIATSSWKGSCILVDPLQKEIIRTQSKWLSDIPGNVAECGVCSGDSARIINRFFPGKTLYLFDTFKGFDERDVSINNDMAASKENSLTFYTGAFSKFADVDTVMSRMPFPDKICIKEGWVPETFNGFSDTFAFVQLDMDLYQPMLEALNFFWDKMSPGGVITLHDYCSGYFKHGVQQAVEDFEIGLGKKVIKSIGLDNYSLVIFKTF